MILSLSVFFLVLVLAFSGFIRGSFGTFPLRQLNAQICDKPAVNNNIPNGIIAFYWAYKWNQISAKLPTVTADDIASTYNKLGFKVDKSDLNDLFRPLKKTTRKNEFLEEHKPDIVFNVMESMSTHILSFDNKDTRDLLGALRKNIKEDMFFTNFVSEGDGTSDSLTRLFVAVPDLNLSTSAYSGKSYICNIVELFKKAGYENLIVTTNGQEAWDKLCELKKAGNIQEAVDCIITDIEMPQMDGHRLTKLAKSDDKIKKIPLVIFSSLVNEEMKRKGEQLGADAQLTKPEIGQLVDAIDDLIANRAK